MIVSVELNDLRPCKKLNSVPLRAYRGAGKPIRLEHPFGSDVALGDAAHDDPLQPTS